MVLATATDRFLMEPSLHRNKIYDFFETIFTCKEVGAGKEEPLIYLKALEFLNLDKSEVWVFEDAFYAMKTAKSAGFKVAAVKDKWADVLWRVTLDEVEEILKAVDLYIDDYTKITPQDFGAAAQT